MQTLLQDVRFGFRMLRKHPGFSLIAILTLALGIGANTAIFSVVDAVLLKSLPVKDPAQLVLLSHTNSDKHSESFSYSNYEQIRDQNQVLSGVLAYYPLRLTVGVDGQPEPALNGQLVTGNYYQVLGVNARLGRVFTLEDDRQPGAHPVCVISHGYWQRRFGSDPRIVGRTIHLGGHPFTVIGVTPPEFFGLEVGSVMDISVPLSMQQQVMAGGRSFVGADWERFRLLGRLRAGVTREQAQASLALLYQQYLADQVVRSRRSPKAREEAERKIREARLIVTPGDRGVFDLRQQFSQPLFVLLCVVALVLLIACANVAGLLLARGEARRKEMGVRLALGAGRLRLVRQLFTESLLLACLGSLLGLLLAWWGTQLLLPLLSQREIPLSLNLNLDLRLLSFTVVVTLLTSVLFGLTPAFLATRVELQSALKHDAPGRSSRSALSVGRVFVIAQVALSLILLVGAGLFVRSLQKLQQVETGYTRENVLALKLEPVGSDSKTPQLAVRYNDLLKRVEAIPGVRAASLVGYSPISRREWLVAGENPEQRTWPQLYVEGRLLQFGTETAFNFMQVYPNSFATLGIPLVQGRDISPHDTRQSQTVAVINESMARRFFGDKNPLGQRFSYDASRAGEMEIIGVVKDARYISLREEGRPMFYVPFTQLDTSMGQMTLLARTMGETAPLAAAIQREARAFDPAMPRFEVETLASQLDVSLTPERLIARLSSLFGVLALVLVCLGLYGVMAYDIARRTHEIGIRMALGAARLDVLRLVIGRGLRLVLIGLGLGLAGALALTRLVRGLLFGVSASDPLVLAGVTTLLLFVALLACWIPARRATKVDPMMALRCD